MNSYRRSKIGIIGGGISGISAAFNLHEYFDITLFEKNAVIGGHSNTITVTDHVNHPHDIDTGFIVYNDRNYPGLTEFFKSMNIERIETEMSFSFVNDNKQIQYAGTLKGLTPTFKSLFSCRHIKLLLGIWRYSRKLEHHRAKFVGARVSIVDALSDIGTPPELIENYFCPIAGAIWSCPVEDVQAIPADTYINFFSNHGLLNLLRRPKWYSIKGGSRRYLDKFQQLFKGTILTNASVEKISENTDSVDVKLSSGELITFDKVIVATHADQALRIVSGVQSLGDQSLKVLKSYRYTRNRVTLHTDTNVLPHNRRLWASWNVRRTKVSGSEVSETTYYMNRLQRLKSSTNFFNNSTLS